MELPLRAYDHAQLKTTCGRVLLLITSFRLILFFFVCVSRSFFPLVRLFVRPSFLLLISLRFWSSLSFLSFRVSLSLRFVSRPVALYCRVSFRFVWFHFVVSFGKRGRLWVDFGATLGATLGLSLAYEGAFGATLGSLC